MSNNSHPISGTRTITASEFNAKCLELMNEVTESGEEIIITKNGKPVAKLAPYKEQGKTLVHQKPESMFGKDRGKIKILGDIVSPMPAEWFSDTGDSEEVLT